MFVPGMLKNLSVKYKSSNNVGSQILKPAEKKQKYVYGGMNTGRPVTPPRKQKNKK